MSNGKGYNEKYFENFSSLLGDGSRLFNTRLYAADSAGNSDSLETDGMGNLKVTGPEDSYVLGYTLDVLTTVTRASDSKVITLGYTGDNLTSVSDWT